MSATTTARHESTTEPGVWFWAERQDPVRQVGPVLWIVVAGRDGQRPTEAFDDWLTSEQDADEIARQLAAGLI